VIEHMQAKRVKRAILLTDGYVGHPQGALQAYLQSVQLGVAYTQAHSEQYLSAFTLCKAVLPIE